MLKDHPRNPRACQMIECSSEVGEMRVSPVTPEFDPEANEGIFILSM